MASENIPLSPELQWSDQVIKGLERENHAAVAVGQKIFSFGGDYHGKRNFSRDGLMDIHILDLTSSPMEWKLLSLQENEQTPPHMQWHRVVANGDLIYLWGGWTQNGCSDILYIFNTKSLTWEKPSMSGEIPKPKRSHTAVIIKNKMYIWGGYEDEGGRYPPEMYAMDLETLSWSLIPTEGTPPAVRYYHTATVYKDRYMFVLGGWERDKYGSSSLVRFDEEKKKWDVPKTTGVILPTLYHHSAFMYNNMMYTFGGYNSETNTRLAEMFRYDPENKHWQKVIINGQGPSPRHSSDCAVIDDRVFLICGNGIVENIGAIPRHRFMHWTLDDTFILKMGQ